MAPVFTIGDRLWKARETAGMSQQRLADVVGIARASVVNYEKGHTAPREIVLRAWALATGVPLEWLRDGIEPDATCGLRPNAVSTRRRQAGRHLALVPTGPAERAERADLAG